MLNKLIMFIIAMVLAAGVAYAAPADLPKTGQTTCYDAAGAVVASIIIRIRCGSTEERKDGRGYRF